MTFLDYMTTCLKLFELGNVYIWFASDLDLEFSTTYPGDDQVLVFTDRGLADHDIWEHLITHWKVHIGWPSEYKIRYRGPDSDNYILSESDPLMLHDVLNRTYLYVADTASHHRFTKF